MLGGGRFYAAVLTIAVKEPWRLGLVANTYEAVVAGAERRL